jgi:purine-cytosine permease-like protein
MISVAATAIGMPFHMTMPGLGDRYPNSLGWVLTVLVVGALVTVVAILGFEKIARVSKVSSPWMLLVFVAAALAVLPRLGVTSPGDFWQAANEKIWRGVAQPGRVHFTFWHVTFFAWFCNMAMHIGMADMTILRYARKWQYGLFSAFGMYLGHYMAWVASGILVALALQQGSEVAPGPIAYLGAGVAGLIAVVLASWTTANPTIYRAGLALQTVTPNWRRWKVTAVVGAVTTVVALFPALMMRLLDFVALYGLLLMPMGAVIFADFWLLPRLGLQQDYAERRRLPWGWPAAAAWLVTLGACLLLNLLWGVQIFFLGLPGWFIAIALYVALSYVQQRAARTVPEPVLEHV